MNRFLLAKLQLDHILSHRDPRKRQEAVETVPCNLLEAYQDIMGRINSCEKDDRDLALKIFSWLFHTQRSLRMSELREALAVREDDQDIQEDYLLDAQDIIDCCKSMVMYEEESDIVGFAHYTVQHFLQSEYLPSLLTRVDLAKLCLTYLLFDVFGEGACVEKLSWECRLNTLKFSEFAAKFWGYYSQGEGEENERVRRYIFLLISSKPKKESMVQLQSYSPGPSGYPIGNYPQNRTGLHILASQGLSKILKTMMSNGDDHNIDVLRNYFGLNEWTEESSKAIGMIKDVDDIGHTALHLAARNGHSECAKILLEMGSTGTEMTEKGWTPLHMAARYGQIRIVGLLLDSGVDPSSTDQYGWRPFHVAARYGYREVVEILLVAGVEVNEQLFKAKSTALHLAARYGRNEVAELLLKKGAQMERQDKRGYTALHLAARNGHREIVEKLLDSGAQPNARDNEGRMPWQLAEQKYPEISSLLESYI